jgi:hypothetical protein
MASKNQPIGIFDSGIGGLTVASAISKLLPNEQLFILAIPLICLMAKNLLQLFKHIP